MTPIDYKIQKFLKPKTGQKKDLADDLFEETPPRDPSPQNLYQIFLEIGKLSWITKCPPSLTAQFNLVNKTLHPNRNIAKGVACIALKGTTFPDKRPLCLNLAEKLRNNDPNDECDLVPEPENAFDPFALAVLHKQTQEKIGYIPKAKDLNKTYIEAIKLDKFCGAYILHTKVGDFQGSPSAIMTLITGWK